MIITQNIKDVLLPLKVMWIALSFSVVIQVIALFNAVQLEVSWNFTYPFVLYFVFAFACFLFVYLFHKRFDELIRPVDPKKAPFTRKLGEDEQNYLKYYSRYFVYHLICWAVNDACVIFGFIISMLAKNGTYVLVSAVIALFLNLVVMKPNYIAFVQKKNHYV